MTDSAIAETRLRVLDTLVLEPESVEDWVWGHHSGISDHFVSGTPPLPSDAQERWDLLRGLARDGLVDFVPGDHVDFDVRSALLNLASPDAFCRSAGTWSACAELTDEGAALWERERAVDWARFHTWEHGDDDERGRCVVTVTSGSASTRDERLSTWLSAPALVLTAPRLTTLRPFAATYWKTLRVGYAFDFEMERATLFDLILRVEGDWYGRLRAWSPNS